MRHVFLYNAFRLRDRELEEFCTPSTLAVPHLTVTTVISAIRKAPNERAELKCSL